MGWPPVKCLHRRRDGGCGGGYVKVKMEGLAIGRKLDLSILGSYAELLDTLHLMFPSTNQGSTSIILVVVGNRSSAILLSSGRLMKYITTNY